MGWNQSKITCGGQQNPPPSHRNVCCVIEYRFWQACERRSSCGRCSRQKFRLAMCPAVSTICLSGTRRRDSSDGVNFSNSGISMLAGERPAAAQTASSTSRAHSRSTGPLRWLNNSCASTCMCRAPPTLDDGWEGCHKLLDECTRQLVQDVNIVTRTISVPLFVQTLVCQKQKQ